MSSLSEFAALKAQKKKQEERLDRRAALVCAVMANCFNTDSSIRFTIDDFMPQRDLPALRPMSDEEMLETIRALNASMGGKEIEIYSES